MDTSSAAAECVTLQAAAGFNIHLFPTGQGNIVGNPIEPVVKLTANPLTVKGICLLYTSPSPRDRTRSRMPSSA